MTLIEHFSLKTLLYDFTPLRGDTHAVMSLKRCVAEILAEGELSMCACVCAAYLCSSCPQKQSVVISLEWESVSLLWSCGLGL